MRSIILLFVYLLIALFYWFTICVIVGFLTKIILKKKSDISVFLYILKLGFPACVISVFFNESLWNRLFDLQLVKGDPSYLFNIVFTLIISLLINLLYKAIKKK